MYEPKFGRVLIEREIKEKTTGGIIIPNAKKHASCKGKIVALGETAGFSTSYFKDADGVLQQHTVQTLSIGDEVVFGRYAGTWLDATIDNKGEFNDDGKLFICQDEDILAIIRE
jgi:co-chaperonin GroES (HSP10)